MKYINIINTYLGINNGNKSIMVILKHLFLIF